MAKLKAIIKRLQGGGGPPIAELDQVETAYQGAAGAAVGDADDNNPDFDYTIEN